MSPELKILFEDNHLLVVDKPALLPTMGVSEETPSLVTLAKSYLRKKYHKPGNVYLGVVSRLDAFVSGVVVLARTSKAASRLSDQFRRRTVSKTYLAMVPYLESMESEGTLEHRLVKNEQQHRMMALTSTDPPHPGEKIARLAYRTVGRDQNRRLLEISLETGRKHQIRVQFQAVGCPIIGDRKYDSPIMFKKGIALHSWRLTLAHPTKKKRTIVRITPSSILEIGPFRI